MNTVLAPSFALPSLARRWAWLPPAALAAAALWQGLRLRQALHAGRGLSNAIGPCEQRPARPRARVLVLGDSLAAGIGADRSRHTIPGLLARDFPEAEIVHRARAGARVRDLRRELEATGAGLGRFDAVLLHIGGNDILRATPMGALRREVQALLARLQALSGAVVWLSTANIGLAPVFVPPFSWWLSRRTRRASRLFAACARATGARYVDFYAERAEDLFARAPRRYFARDGLHPSSASYRHCYEVARREGGLAAILGR